MTSGDRGTASDTSDCGSTIGSFFGVGPGPLARPAESEQGAALGASVWGAIAVTAK